MRPLQKALGSGLSDAFRIEGEDGTWFVNKMVSLRRFAPWSRRHDPSRSDGAIPLHPL
jgi:hypothetical protein